MDVNLGLALQDCASLSLSLERDALEQSLYAFVAAAWSVVEPMQPFVGNWHLDRLCEALERCFYTADQCPGRKGPLDRLIINVPPGTAKSLIVNVLFPCWVWAKNPRRRFMFASYSTYLSTRDNVRARQLLESDWFKARWPLVLADDQNNKTKYATKERGWRFATSVGGAVLGEHPDFIVIDDPTSSQQAESEVERQNANDWFDRTVSTRLGRNPVIILIMQRLHKDDLSGHLLARGGWEHICWPMRFEKCTCPPLAEGKAVQLEELCALHRADPEWKPDPRDPRTEPGELLFPTLFPEKKVKELETNLGAYGVAGQLQQRPSPMGGHVFQRAWFKLVDAAPAMGDMRLARGWDTAATEGGGDSTAGILCGELFENVLVPAAGHTRAVYKFQSTGRFYLMDPINVKLGPSGVDQLIRATAARDGKAVAQREEKEGGSAGKTVIDARTKALAGYNYAGVPISGSKATRAKPFRAQLEAGNVYLVGTAQQWDAYIRELCDFTGNGDTHDDYVDATSCAFNAVLLEPPPRKARMNW